MVKYITRTYNICCSKNNPWFKKSYISIGPDTCEYCKEDYLYGTETEIDCGVIIVVYHHESYICPDEKERIPYIHKGKK